MLTTKTADWLQMLDEMAAERMMRKPSSLEQLRVQEVFSFYDNQDYTNNLLLVFYFYTKFMKKRFVCKASLKLWLRHKSPVFK
ncbi:hypothetical protein SD074_21810 [Prolixibacter sp. SD074]|jgi:hypothetical protein|nr:hypothetical protein SD074_21810 [Prolixibacter sp. SD074]